MLWSLDGNVRRAIDIHEGEEIDANAFGIHKTQVSIRLREDVLRDAGEDYTGLC